MEFAHLCGVVDPASSVVLEFAFFAPPSCVWSFIFNFVALFVGPPTECHDAISGASMSSPRLAQPVLGQVQHPPEKVQALPRLGLCQIRTRKSGTIITMITRI